MVGKKQVISKNKEDLPPPLNSLLPGANYVIYGCSYVRKTPRLSLYRRTGAFNLSKNIVAVITQVRVIHDNLKRQIKNRTWYTCKLYLLTLIF